MVCSNTFSVKELRRLPRSRPFVAQQGPGRRQARGQEESIPVLRHPADLLVEYRTLHQGAVLPLRGRGGYDAETTDNLTGGT